MTPTARALDLASARAADWADTLVAQIGDIGLWERLTTIHADEARTHLSSILRTLRVAPEVPLTQRELASRAGVRQQSITAWERGSQVPSEPSLKKLGRILMPAATKTQVEALLTLGRVARRRTLP